MGYFKNLIINTAPDTFTPELLDGIGGYPIYNDNIADLTIFDTNNRVHKFTNLESVEATGITADSTNFKAEYKQIKDWFNNGGSYIWLGVFNKPIAAYDYSELDLMHSQSRGEINIFMIWTPDLVLAEAEIAKIDAKLVAFDDIPQGCVALYGADTATTTLANMIDVRSFVSNYEYVGIVTGQDSANEAVDLALSTSLPEVGTVAGTLSSATISTNIGHVGQFNYASGSVLSEPALCINDGVGDNVILKVIDINDGDIALLEQKRHLFFGFYPNKNGTFLSNDFNCSNGDKYDSQKVIRVRNKIRRLISSTVVDLIKGKVYYKPNSDELREDSLENYYNATRVAMNILQDDSDISSYTVFIDPKQDVRSTSSLTIAVTWDQVYSTDQIVVNVDKI